LQFLSGSDDLAACRTHETNGRILK
jgi:hypothetical protein